MIYQKKSPKGSRKPRITVSFTHENFDFICRVAGELSFALAVDQIVEAARQRKFTTICNSQPTATTIGAEYHVR